MVPPFRTAGHDSVWQMSRHPGKRAQLDRDDQRRLCSCHHERTLLMFHPRGFFFYVICVPSPFFFFFLFPNDFKPEFNVTPFKWKGKWKCFHHHRRTGLLNRWEASYFRRHLREGVRAQDVASSYMRLAISPPNNLCWNESFADWDNSRLSLCVIVISRHRKLQRDLGHSQLWIWKPFQWVKPCSFQTDTIEILCWFPNDFLSCWYRYRFSPSTAGMIGDNRCLMAQWRNHFTRKHPVVFLLIRVDAQSSCWLSMKANVMGHKHLQLWLNFSNVIIIECSRINVIV